ncbi:MAG: hypothetical protein JNL09_04125 [Anaerolineales bacterium]|nr:hypothetical protein [Anaerolineales bacterium]
MTHSNFNPYGNDYGPLDASHSPDISSNRAGELTESQKKSLRGRLMPRFVGSAIGLGLLGPLAICFIGPIVFSSGIGEDVWFAVFFIGLFALMFGGMLLGLVWNSWRPGLGLLDLMSNRVETADGRLTWRGRGWRGDTERGELHLLPLEEQMPGAYRFYFLPRSRYIVTTEQLRFSGQDTDPLAEVRRALGSVFGFVDEDLPENRTGRLSPRQQQHLFFNNVRTALFLSPFLLMALGFGLGLPFGLVIYPMLTGERMDSDAWFGAACGGGLGLLFVGILSWVIISPFLDLWRGEVTSIEGEVTEQVITTGSGKNRRTNYYYSVNGQRFNVGQQAHQALIQGRRYRLFYFPQSKAVVSVEPLAESSPDFASARL